jgi:Matrixin
MRPDGREGRLRRSLVGLAALLACGGVSQAAAAFCRTTTCGLPPNFAPSPGQCTPPDFVSRCASLDPPAKVLPIYWSNACVSYDIQKDASVQVPYDTAAQFFAAAFAKWTGTTCATGGRVSIDTKDLGPVDCDLVQYSSDQGNQHVIIFHDDTWPHEGDANTTLALTTMTFDPDTGEIYDADMELNSFDNDFTVTNTGVQFDLQSIVTHETGHFLGLAHSADMNAVMWPEYVAGTTTLRTLSPDDVAAICTVYPPSPVNSDCDATPRHGFSPLCEAQQPTPSSCCTVAPGSESGRGPAAGVLVVLSALVLAARRSRLRASSAT